MGRKRKEALWPVELVPFVEAVLHEEGNIRKAVEAQKGEPVYLSSYMGNNGGRRGGIADPTARQALKRAEAEELAFITLPSGKELGNPEAWLSAFDEVRRMAKSHELYPLIIRVWENRYQGDSYDPYYGKVYRDTIHGKIVIWIWWKVLEAAEKRGLIDYEGQQSLEDVAESASEKERNSE